MRIGILTLPSHCNYGGILQAYALQTILERMGHEVIVFDTPNEWALPPLWKLPLSFSKRILMKCFDRSHTVFFERHLKRERHLIAQFVDTYIHRKIIHGFKELRASDYKAIVVGSDQIWRPFFFSQMWYRKPMENAFLAFAENWDIKRLSYAASFGTDEWEYTDKETERCKKLLEKFDAISVREEGGVVLCCKYFGKKAQHVLDPTMLLSSDDYINLFQKCNTPKSKGNLLVYILDESPELRNLVDEIVKNRHFIPFSVNNSYIKDEDEPLNEKVNPSVESWLRGFYDAELVVTDSFHACVFSIIFRKQFVVVGNKSRGMSRFESLLKMFGLQDRLVNGSDGLQNLGEINYDVVYEKYEALKLKSYLFLQDNL